ncbi:hypothetical protein INT43_006686 [Umbelopsis isabellina]|uniref:K Homology domain-containing protein n=1 Tax=Mortierella isabellina TaxID=91625 RepID=A0A8H7Q0J1_MORIS|nr:hypothetical protein INT43_006686 [Umbelopsis isabellina]
MKATAAFLNQVLEADHGDTPITLRALIPAFLSGTCIGKGGETHRELERQFGTNIYFGTENARGTRLASVAGTIQRVARTWRECAFLMYRKKNAQNGKKMSIDILVPSLLAEKLKEVPENGGDSEFAEISVLSGITMVLKKDLLANSTEQLLQLFITGLDLQDLLQFETAMRLVGRTFQRYIYLAFSPDNIYYIPGQDFAFDPNDDESEVVDRSGDNWGRQIESSNSTGDYELSETMASDEPSKADNYMETSWGPVRQIAGGQTSKVGRSWDGIPLKGNDEEDGGVNDNGHTGFASNISGESQRREYNGDDFLPTTWGPLSDAPNRDNTVAKPVRSRSQQSHNTDSAPSVDSYNAGRSSNQRPKATPCTLRLLISNAYAQILFRKDYSSQTTIFRQLNNRYYADRMFITPITSSLSTVPRNQFCYVQNDAGPDNWSNNSEVLKWPRIVQFTVDVARIAGITGDIARLLPGEKAHASDSLIRLMLSERYIQCLTAQEETMKNLRESSNCQILVCEENLGNSDERVVIITGDHVNVGKAIHQIYSTIHSKMRLADIHKPIRFYAPAEAGIKGDSQQHMGLDERT